MNSRQRPTLSTGHPHWRIQLTDDGSRTLVDAAQRVGFHSAAGARTETEHVYLGQSGVLDRLKTGAATNVLELGLGTAMGLLMTLDAAVTHGTQLRFVSLESQWLESSLIGQLEPWRWTSNGWLVDQYLQWRDRFPPCPDTGEYIWEVGRQWTIGVQIGPAELWPPEAESVFDAVYFDPFAPDVSGPLWESEILRRMHWVLVPGGRLVTYCVNRRVRDAAATAGFEVQVVPGPPGGKREVMVATRRT